MAMTEKERAERKYFYNRNHRANNLEKVRQQEKTARDKYRDKLGHDRLLQYTREYREKNRKHLNRVDLIRSRAKIDSLADVYVAWTIRKGTDLKKSDIPKELIELKRQQIILHRTIREIQKCKT